MLDGPEFPGLKEGFLMPMVRRTPGLRYELPLSIGVAPEDPALAKSGESLVQLAEAGDGDGSGLLAHRGSLHFDPCAAAFFGVFLNCDGSHAM